MVHMRENLNAFSLHRDAEMIQGFDDAKIALLHDQSVISHLCGNMNGGDGHNQQDREDKVGTHVSDPFKRTSTSRVKKSSLIHADYGSQHNRPSSQFLRADLEGDRSEATADAVIDTWDADLVRSRAK